MFKDSPYLAVSVMYRSSHRNCEVVIQNVHRVKRSFAVFIASVPWHVRGSRCLSGRQISFGHIFTYFVVRYLPPVSELFLDLSRVVGISLVVFTLLRSDAYAVYGCASVSLTVRQNLSRVVSSLKSGPLDLVSVISLMQGSLMNPRIPCISYCSCLY